jgi:signal transduction histidine kinase
VKEYLQTIKGRLARGENLIQGILEYARVGSEMQEKDHVDLNQLLGEIRDNLPPKHGLLLTVQSNFPVLFTERLPIMQIFSNLITNAIKHNSKSDPRVRVYYEEKDNHYNFFVEDNGPGISQNYQDRIFVIFQTLQERDSFESTGVGLAIVKKILDDRNQKISIVSEPGKGSTFVFTWPKI